MVANFRDNNFHVFGHNKKFFRDVTEHLSLKTPILMLFSLFKVDQLVLLIHKNQLFETKHENSSVNLPEIDERTSRRLHQFESSIFARRNQFFW